MKTYSIKESEIKRSWFLVDAKDQTLGRLSSKVAQILRGKNKVNYTPHIDMSDHVIVINSDQIKLSGDKVNKKEYWSQSGYPGGGKTKSYKSLIDDNADSIILNADKGMLPHNKLSNQLIKHLKIYKNGNHPHKSQTPKLMEI